MSRHQPQPTCGFVLKGTSGTISSYDYELNLRVQTERQPGGYNQPADTLKAPMANPIQYFIHCLETGVPVAGPLSPVISRIGQQIVDAAVLSARTKKAVKIAQSK